MFTAGIRRRLNPTIAQRHFGNFELYHPIPPRYFLVKYELDQRQFREKVIDSAGAELAVEHRDKVQKAVADQLIVFRGELLPQRDVEEVEGAEETTTVAH